MKCFVESQRRTANRPHTSPARLLVGRAGRKDYIMIVEVTEFVLPHGRQVVHNIEISDKCQSSYDAILSCNAKLTCEALRTCEVSQTIDCGEFDFDIILTSGRDLDENEQALEKMIMRFDKDECLRQIDEQRIAEKATN